MEIQHNDSIVAVAYARFSSSNQREESIEAQLRAIHEYAARNNITIIREYIDRAMSARSDQRPDFQRMIKDARRKDFSMVIVHKLDRFSRDRYDSSHYKYELKKHGVRLNSVTENIDDSPESVIMESVLEGMAEYYSKNLAREAMKGLKENAHKGMHTGGVPPFGYRIDPATKKPEVHPEEANAVRLIFDMAYRGEKYADIVRELNSRGYRTKHGNEFNSTCLHELLKNRKYIGECIYNKRVSQSVCNSSRVFKDESEWIVRTDVYEPLVSVEVFEAVQQRIRERSLRRAPSKRGTYLLTGKIECAECGGYYCGTRKKNGKGTVSYAYVCNHKKKDRNDKGCRNPMVSCSLLEGYVLEKLAEFVFSDSMIPEITERYNKYLNEQNSTSANALTALNKELALVERKIDSTMELLLEMKSKAMMENLAKLEQRRDALLKDISELTTDNTEITVTEAELKLIFEEIRRSLANGSLSNVKQLVDKYVHKVVVYPHKIVVMFNLFPSIKLPSDKNSGNNQEECSDEGHSSFMSVPEGMEICVERSSGDTGDFAVASCVLDRIRHRD